MSDTLFVVNIYHMSGTLVETIGKDGMSLSKAEKVERGVLINLSDEHYTDVEPMKTSEGSNEECND